MSNRRILATLVTLAVLAAAGLFLAGYGYMRWVGRLQPGGPSGNLTIQFFSNPTTLTPVTMQTLDGRTLSSSDWHGKVTIVNFWATWCAPCRAEIPALVALQDKYRDELQIVGISQDEEGPEVVRQFAADYQINYPLVMMTRELLRAFSGVYALPTTFIIDRDLRVVQKHVGLLNMAATEQETRALAGLSTNASIEFVEDSDRKKIENAAQATTIPGLEIEKLSAAARTAVLQRLNADTCTCGCGLTLAACRINDSSCGVSLPLAQKIVDAVAAGRDPSNSATQN